MSSIDTLGKQQLRTEATRDTILDAAVRLYHEQGVAGTTVSAIIAASGIGRTTFYRHFTDQDEVLDQALRRDFDSLMAEFDAQRFEHSSLEAQIVEDMVWFVRQMKVRPALSLLFGPQKNQFVDRINATLDDLASAGMTCVQPTFERARREGRLRDGVILANYVAWATFVVTSLEVVEAPFTDNDFMLRDTLRHFLVPSLIRDP